MSYANNITRLCEMAARDYLISVALSGIDPNSIFAGFDASENLPTPRLVCTCNAADTEGPEDDAVWACQLQIKAVSNADDVTEDDHHEFAGEAFAAFMIGRLQTADAISAAATGFNCQDVLPQSQSKSVEERRWESVFVLKLVCCGSDLGN